MNSALVAKQNRDRTANEMRQLFEEYENNNEKSVKLTCAKSLIIEV